MKNKIISGRWFYVGFVALAAVFLAVYVFKGASTSFYDNGTAVTDSGISGVVALEPGCPVQIEGEECGPIPYETGIDIFREHDREEIFTSIISDEYGAFRVSLPPGGYVVRVRDAMVLPRCPEIETDVLADSYSDIEIVCDSGIR